MGLRLLHAIASINPADGGPVEGVRQLSTINSRYGHVVEIVTVDSPDAKWVKESTVRVHALGPASGGVYGFSLKFLDWMRKNANHYDAIIINGIWGFNAFGSWLALRKQNVPYMVFTHGMLDPWFKYRYPLKHIKKWLYWPWGLYPVLRDASAVFFTCERERVLARDSFWLYDCNEIVVHYGTSGIPNPDFDYRSEFLAAHPALAATRNILFIGRVHPKKGPDLLIRAVGQLKRKGEWNEEVMRIVMAGPVDSGYAQQLRLLAEKEGIANSVYWTGMLTGSEKWGAFQASEAFILPSHQENFGIAVAEALSARLPVLITHSVNISPEIAIDGAGLVDDDTVKGAYRLLRKWFSLPEDERKAMSVQARDTFRSRFTADASAKDMCRQIYLILSARKARIEEERPAVPAGR